MELLRIATAGSVDDGKSTLIGRLLLDTHAVPEDQLAAVAEASRRRGHTRTDLALLTDGLRAEREQGITIDVAYRYVHTTRRKLIIADTPGHLQYTRNMVTGASTADLAVILVDARTGLSEQSRRHAYLCALLGVPHLTLAVNKMDLVGFDRTVFERIAGEFAEFCDGMGVPAATAIPLSALDGDNVTEPSARMSWYRGPTLLHHLEQAEIDPCREGVGLRFPVQYVIEPVDAGAGGRALAGRLAAGVIRVGDQVRVLPGGRLTWVTAVETPQGPVAQAYAPMSVTVRLADDAGVTRGDMLTWADGPPRTSREMTAMICWMDPRPLEPNAEVLVKHTTRVAPAEVAEVISRVDVNTLRRHGTDRLALNEIGWARLHTGQDLAYDDYRANRSTGGFIIIDPATRRTVGAGMIVDRDALPEAA
jgi:bifunctional enzyme CysN/CysC